MGGNINLKTLLEIKLSLLSPHPPIGERLAPFRKGGLRGISPSSKKKLIEVLTSAGWVRVGRRIPAKRGWGCIPL